MIALCVPRSDPGQAQWQWPALLATARRTEDSEKSRPSVSAARPVGDRHTGTGNRTLLKRPPPAGWVGASANCDRGV